MTSVFLFFAVIGGSIMVFQLVMILLGLGHDGLDADASDAFGHVDVGDLSGGADLDLDGAGSVDVGAHDIHDAQHPDSTQAFKILSFRTIVAAVTFFGLGGLLGESAELRPLPATGLAIAAGLAAMWLVYKLYATLYSIQGEGTVRIDAAVGCYGTVYLTIPGEEAGQGKVLINVQGRTMEYPAVTPGEKLASGQRIVVTRVITNNTVEVESALETRAEPKSEADRAAS